MSTASESDPRQLADTKAKEIAGLSWEELDQHGKQVEDVVTAGGRRFRVKSIAFWDMDEWTSAMYVIVNVYPVPRWRRFWGYSAVETRGGWDDDEAIPERPES